MHKFHFSNVTSWVAHWTLWQYWVPTNLLSTAPAAYWPWQWEYVGLLGLLLAGALVVTFVNLPGRLNSQLASLAWNNLLFGVILFFFRYQHVPILGMDIWRLIQECVIVAWLVSIIVQFRRTYPSERLAARVQAYRSRFLPKPKPR